MTAIQHAITWQATPAALLARNPWLRLHLCVHVLSRCLCVDRERAIIAQCHRNGKPLAVFFTPATSLAVLRWGTQETAAQAEAQEEAAPQLAAKAGVLAQDLQEAEQVCVGMRNASSSQMVRWAL